MAQGYVRAARPQEAAEIARIQVTAWRVGYRRFLPASVLAGLDQDWMAQQWRAAIEAPPGPRHRVLVAVEQPERTGRSGQTEPAGRPALVGFVAAGPADQHAAAPGEPDPPGERTAAVTDLLVEPRWGRRGHGSRLLAAAVAHWREDGFATAVAWAFEADPATRSFLTSAGWQPDGARRALDVDDLLVEQVRLHTLLGAEEGSPLTATA